MISDQGVDQQTGADATHLSLQQELNIPFPPSVQQAALEEKGARKFHFHLARPLLSKEMAAQYTLMVDPYAAFAMKHINQVHFYTNTCSDTSYEISLHDKFCVSLALNGAFALARQTDHLELDNNSLDYKMEGMKKAISFKNNLNKELIGSIEDKRQSSGRRPSEWRDYPRNLLKRGKLPRHDDIVKASEVLEQTIRDAEMALASAAAMAETARIQFANSTLRSFISSPAYEKKMGSECETYFHSLVASTSERFPDLIALFNEEMARPPDWYRGLNLPPPKVAFLLEEGGETPNLPIE
ncbi:hypothetical protein LIER_35123 [Lithospermum erythrorhizon]|uniref:Uncharacterized protein n=1 Tax=Lithospermum erythrorhizon TaxID=34254 RepID=A0AAV3NK11_LITER